MNETTRHQALGFGYGESPTVILATREPGVFLFASAKKGLQMVATIEGLSASQAARELGLSEARIHQMVRKGDLPFTKTALGRLIDRKAVLAMKADRALQSGETNNS